MAMTSTVVHKQLAHSIMQHNVSRCCIMQRWNEAKRRSEEGDGAIINSRFIVALRFASSKTPGKKRTEGKERKGMDVRSSKGIRRDGSYRKIRRRRQWRRSHVSAVAKARNGTRFQ